MTLAKCP